MKSSIELYFSEVRDIAKEFPTGEVVQLVNAVRAAYESDRTIFVMGNGGSASTASHFAADLNKNAITNGRRPRVIALTDNVEAITAWGNDSAYEDVFVEQLRNYYREGDIVVAISGSGQSPNILKTVTWARERRATVLALTGPRGVSLKQDADVCVVAPVESMEQIEDFHVICMHAMIVGMRNYYGKTNLSNHDER